MHLVCTVTVNYLPTAYPFLASSAVVSSATKWCVCYKFAPSPALRAAYPHVAFVPMGPVASESFNMIQHGRFLDALPLPPDALVCLSDTDVVVTRDFSRGELAAFGTADADTLSAGLNADAADTLAREAERIDYAGPLPDGVLPIYNCGVMVGRAGVFTRVRDEYERDCHAFYAATENRSRCQFQFWRAWHRMAGRKRFVPLPPDVHQHGHFGTPPHPLTNVMFRHKL